MNKGDAAPRGEGEMLAKWELALEVGKKAHGLGIVGWVPGEMRWPCRTLLSRPFNEEDLTQRSQAVPSSAPGGGRVDGGSLAGGAHACAGKPMGRVFTNPSSLDGGATGCLAGRARGAGSPSPWPFGDAPPSG